MDATVRVQELSNGWVLARDPQNRGREEGWFGSIRAEAVPAPVPGIIQQVFPGYHGVAWYWRAFSLPCPAGPDERVVIRFGAVDYLAEVWVNGQPVGGCEGGETPFELDITQAVVAGVENLLAGGAWADLRIEVALDGSARCFNVDVDGRRCLPGAPIEAG